MASGLDCRTFHLDIMRLSNIQKIVAFAHGDFDLLAILVDKCHI